MRIAALALAFCISGCSFIFVRGPSSDRAPGDCTTSILAPVLDLTWAGLNGYGALNVAAVDQATWDAQNPSASRGGVIAVGAAFAVVNGLSAVYGFKSTEACRAAEAAQAAKIPPPPPD